ncbi:probable calcium-binding protein CML27 [Nymphaea colorata]|uniref:EF-hand domain-containing protein n=1 Tax=Nymphaea colorata TaxID=210225 RepID=A0A5K1G218_9MAGN|nr:probable calcium-binding protein CML27 [Nymphaea colorata]
MKLSDLKHSGSFKIMRTGSSKRNPPLSSTPGEMSKSVSASPRQHKPMQGTARASASPEITFASPSSGGFYSPSPQWEVDQVFKMFDKDGDGKISCYELGSILRRLGDESSDEEVMRMLTNADEDGDGFINMEEFDRVSMVASAAAAADLIDAFNVFDTDRDGKISVYELHRVFVALGDEGCTLEDCLRMIKKVDGDGDGYVSFEDFIAMMTRS